MWKNLNYPICGRKRKGKKQKKSIVRLFDEIVNIYVCQYCLGFFTAMHMLFCKSMA